jgi:undecaprenyl-diphosphatase
MGGHKLILKAIILGILEGLTEFLPVSSTGHLIILSQYINFTGEFANTFNVVIQVGAILAVVFYFWNKLLPDFKNKRQARKVYNLWGKVIIGVIPAVILGVLFEDEIDKYLMGNSKAVAAALIVGAILLLIAESRSRRSVTVSTTDQITYGKSFLVGVFQCLAMWPGMSRSASTIIGGLFLGLSREAAAEYSFFLAIPTLFGASALKLYKFYKAGFVFSSAEWAALMVGVVVSFIVAFVVIAAFMGYVRKKKLSPFAYYRIVLGILVLLLVK